MNMQQLMQQAQRMQEQMQKQMAKAQEELANSEIHGESGAGLVKITMTGRHDVKRVEIDDNLLPVPTAAPAVQWPHAYWQNRTWLACCWKKPAVIVGSIRHPERSRHDRHANRG